MVPAGSTGRYGQGVAVNLRDNLADLLERFRSGSYQAPPVRRGSPARRPPLSLPPPRWRYRKGMAKVCVR